MSNFWDQVSVVSLVALECPRCLFALWWKGYSLLFLQIACTEQCAPALHRVLSVKRCIYCRNPRWHIQGLVTTLRSTLRVLINRQFPQLGGVEMRECDMKGFCNKNVLISFAYDEWVCYRLKCHINVLQNKECVSSALFSIFLSVSEVQNYSFCLEIRLEEGEVEMCNLNTSFFFFFFSIHPQNIKWKLDWVLALGMERSMKYKCRKSTGYLNVTFGNFMNRQKRRGWENHISNIYGIFGLFLG